ncbi:MAG: hypothetical protein V4647_14740 [Pseudomonadota bacterium]
MPSLTDYWPVIMSADSDVTPRLCFRLAGRSLGLIGVRYSGQPVNYFRAIEPLFLDIFKTLLISSSQLSHFEAQNMGRIVALHSKLSSYAQQEYQIVAYRSLLNAFLPKGRPEHLEDLRRCIQSVKDKTSNLARIYRGLPVDSVTEMWSDLDNHITFLTDPNNRKTLTPPITEGSPILMAWQTTKSLLLSSNESWRVWTDWYDYRFRFIPSPNIPSFLWRDIEEELIADSSFWRTDDIDDVNGLFAAKALEKLEKLVDHQAAMPQISSSVNFEIDENSLKVLRPDDKLDIAVRNESAVEEVLRIAEQMLDICNTNSASHLRNTVCNYIDVFQGATWKSPIPLVLRGDALRKSFDAQISRPYDSDLPEIGDNSMLVFRNLIRAHNLLISLHPALREIDNNLESTRSERHDTATKILRSIINFTKSRRELNVRNLDALHTLESLMSKDDDENSYLLNASVFNFVKSAGAFLWNKRLQLTAGGASILGTTYALSQWMLANEAWLLSYFNLNSPIGALIRSAIEIIKRLPLA